MPLKERRFPFHVHISVLLTLLLLATGMVLGFFNYRQTSQIILSGSQQLFGQIIENVEADLQNTYQPIRHLLDLLLLDERIQGSDTRQRLALLPVFTRALNDNPRLSSLYLGYADGDFFMVRPLRNETLRRTLTPPEDAAYQVWSIEHDDSGQIVSNYLYYDSRLNALPTSSNPAERYDPRTRSWYRTALGSNRQITTEPYVFFSSGDIGTTLAVPGRNGTVLAADLTLADLSATLARHRMTPSTELVLYRPDGAAVAYPGLPRQLHRVDDRVHLTPVRQLSPVLGTLFERGLQNDRRGSMRLGNKDWQVAYTELAEGGPNGLRLAVLAPEEELLADARRIRWQGAVLTLALLLFCVPLGWFMSRLLVRPLRALVSEAKAIRNFDFSHPAAGHSLVLEVDQLAVAMGHMKDTLSSFLEITSSLSAEKRFDTLLQRILRETTGFSEARCGLLYLRDEQSGALTPHGLFIDGELQSLAQHQIVAYPAGSEYVPEWLAQVANGGSTQIIDLGFDQAHGLRGLLHELDSPRVHLAATALRNRQGETLGVLVLAHPDSGELPTALRPERIAFVEALSGVAALCIESQRLLDQQKNLLDAFIQLIAGAIDAKSPYTGGHCQRVPELTFMLAQAAAASDEPPMRDYQPTAEDWEALHIAAWLHDCGKVTTPEYVVDKATKLETLYDRIHEVRMRFEVLKRDAQIDYWRGLANGEAVEHLAQARDELLATLDEEFAFIARCNLGAETSADSDLQRLRRIAGRTWQRTLDDRIGVSWEEHQRQARTPPSPLPVLEPLLADKPEHIIERPPHEIMPSDNPWGFRLDPPLHKFNRGELYNLGVRRGTLTREERFIIGDHMVQTIRMLSHLPFPKHLRNVVEIAGGHHEKMDGSGYPKRLKREQMSLPARIMAIADIFEALTAIDRPYKKGKTLSEALSIMARMCREAHIDPDLFALFVRARVPELYGQRFLRPEQLDQVDEAAILADAGMPENEKARQAQRRTKDA
ncbi:HD domain-containing phosphohydrolase [Pseudomonas sp. LRF_L74]|uniref:HD domain-containing phosphohydrolase n=1 Tax=Pseudomonas sp. LRF_L74 TaxID=3369422 RepID=UPI003F60EE86